MSEPRIYVDFNEMPSADEVLLSRTDAKQDSSGTLVQFVEGLKVSVYMDDLDEHGKPDNLIAEGTAHRNSHVGWASAARWVLRIDGRGIRHVSDEKTSTPSEG